MCNLRQFLITYNASIDIDQRNRIRCLRHIFKKSFLKITVTAIFFLTNILLSLMYLMLDIDCLSFCPVPILHKCCKLRLIYLEHFVQNRSLKDALYTVPDHQKPIPIVKKLKIKPYLWRL